MVVQRDLGEHGAQFCVYCVRFTPTERLILMDSGFHEAELGQGHRIILRGWVPHMVHSDNMRTVKGLIWFTEVSIVSTEAKDFGPQGYNFSKITGIHMVASPRTAQRLDLQRPAELSTCCYESHHKPLWPLCAWGYGSEGMIVC